MDWLAANFNLGGFITGVAVVIASAILTYIFRSSVVPFLKSNWRAVVVVVLAFVAGAWLSFPIWNYCVDGHTDQLSEDGKGNGKEHQLAEGGPIEGGPDGVNGKRHSVMKPQLPPLLWLKRKSEHTCDSPELIDLGGGFKVCTKCQALMREDEGTAFWYGTLLPIPVRK